ncbi:MAG: hypothetical protein COC10_05610 [Sphingobium sp.]|jgi:hypothetical protein|nr:MAG: hypothetical protein COC10_05610 [Sphingobium sp.]
MFSGAEERGEVVGSGSALVGFLALMVSCASMLWTWYEKGRTAASDRVKTLEGRLDLMEDRQLRVEGEVAHLPTKDDVNNLKMQLVELLGITNRQQSELSTLVRTVNRIDDYLREKQ